MHKRITIKNLLLLGRTKSSIAKELGVHRNTVSNIENEYPIKEKVERIKKKHELDEHQNYIIRKLDYDGLSYTRIRDDLQREKGVTVDYDVMRYYILTRKLKGKGKAYIVLHSDPGEEMQVDFGYVGLQPDETGKQRKAWVFVGTLGFSRKPFHKLVFNQTVSEFILCHIEAFEYFGGVSQKVKIDNLKSAVLNAHFYEPEYQKEYHAFSKHYNFIIHDCKVRSPEEKGKVESGVKYVKNNFFKGRTFASKKECEEALFDWQENKCNKRIHGTTKKVPEIIFENEEKEKLKPLPLKRWEVCSWERRKVSTTSHIIIDKNYYSVPYKHNGEEVDIKITKNQITIYKNNEQIALHTKIQGIGEYQTNVNHYPDYKRFDTEEYKETQEQQISDIGEYAEKYLFFLKSKGSDSPGRDTRGIIHLYKLYGSEAVNLACKRALAFEVSGYKIIENICKKKLYLDFTDVPKYNQTPQTGKLERPLTYYSQIICNLTLITWNLLLHFGN
jgi:transposase